MERAPPFIPSSAVHRYLTYEDLIPEMEKALASYSQGGDIVQPVRVTLPIENGYCMVMPALSLKNDMIVSKILVRNRQRKATVKHQILVLMAVTSGKVLSIIESALFSGIRTAAVSAIATKYLAREDSEILAIIGSGEQAASHIQALSLVHSFKQIRVCSRNIVNAEKIANRFGCKAYHNIEEAVRDADIIVTATTSKTPVLKYEWVKHGAHINCIGACYKEWQELDPVLMQRSDVYTDTKAGAMEESGDIILSGVRRVTELGDVILGRHKVKRDVTTVFKTLGMAVEDLAAAKLIYNKFSMASKL